MSNARQYRKSKFNTFIIDNAISVLDKYAPIEDGIFSSLEGKKQISKKDFDKSTDKAEDFMDEAEQLIQWSKEISEKKAPTNLF